MKVVMLDNYDSFTYNLVQYLGMCGAQTHTFRNDQVSLAQLQDLAPDRIVISPGPGNPEKNPACLGVGLEVLGTLSREVPTLGVCLGCQAIGAAFGAKVVAAKRLMHGKTSTICHNGAGLFAGLSAALPVARYHSLALDAASIQAPLEVTARSDDGEVMAVRHLCYPIYGVQFHPESILTTEGMQMIENFLALDERALR